MTRLAQIRALLAEHRSTLETNISINEQACVDRVTRLILDDLTDQSRTYLRRVEKHERDPDEGPFGTLGAMGRNGAGPAIADIVRQSEFHRCRGKMEQAA
jgi:hypothetical protein